MLVVSGQRPARPHLDIGNRRLNGRFGSTSAGGVWDLAVVRGSPAEWQAFLAKTSHWFEAKLAESRIWRQSRRAEGLPRSSS